MGKNPLETIKKLDTDLYDSIAANRELAFREGQISTKHKLLIALAVDASKEAVEGVRSLARQVMEVGGTKDEIMETLRIVHYICGAGTVYGAAVALENI